MLGRRERRARSAVEQWRSAIDRACGTLNPILAVIVIGLLVLNVSCYAALEIGRRHVARLELSPPPPPPPALARNAGLGPP